MVQSRYIALGLLVGLGGALRAHADWPVARHDAKRTATAAAAGATAITKPAPYWRYYLGGTLGARSYIASDVNKDGVVEIVYAAGGKIIAKLPNDTVVWESPPVGIGELVGIDDLDGDGKLDVVGFSGSQTFVVSGDNGAIEWEEKQGEMGTIGAVRMGDLDGDGKPDVFIDECGCCGVNSGSPGVAYSFAGGYAAATTPTWTSPARSRCGASGTTIGDFDGDGKADVGTSNYSTAAMARGLDGTLLGTSMTTGTRVDRASCDTANVDARVGDEMVCFQDVYQAAGSVGGHQIFVLTYDVTATPTVKTLWSHALGDLVNDVMRHVGNSLVDLDADGKYEIVVSEYHASAWTTQVYDAATGTLLTSIPGSVLQAIQDLTGGGKPAILTSTAGANDLVATSFDRTAAPMLSTRWTMPGPVSVQTEEDWPKARRNDCDNRGLAVDLDGDNVPDPVLHVPAAGMTPASLTGYKATAMSTPTAIASFTIPDGVALLTHDVFPMVNRGYDQLLVARNDGFLLVLDNALAPTNATIGGEFAVPGMRIGGYYSGAYGDGYAPIAPRLGGTSDSVIVSDSRTSLLRIESAGATLLTPPTVMWTLPSAYLASAVDALDGGKRGLVMLKGGLTAVDAAGTTLWNTPVPNLVFEPLAGDTNGDGVPDIFTETRATGSIATYQVYDGKTGAALWASPPTGALSAGTEPFAVGDWNTDGVADLYAVFNSPFIYSGTDGSVLASNPANLAYFEPVLADVNFDGIEDITMTGGYSAVRTYQHDLNTQIWATTTDDRPYAFGARSECPGQISVWVQSSLQTPGQVRITPMNGAMQGVAATIYLAEGASYADPATATTAGKHLGIIGNATVKLDLTGAGSHPSTLLGSTDGWLYAIDACNAGSIDWAYNFHFPVGEPIFADTSGDGVDEILVTAADGYLYALSQELIAAPGYVWDLDPPHGNTSADVDTITTEDSLYASWAPVTGADSYEVAVLTIGGSYVTQPNWQNVGNVTQIGRGTLPLVDGGRYIFAVRAVSNAKGSSVETASNGVTVTIGAVPVPDLAMPADLGAADAAGMMSTPVNKGCGCSVGGATDTRGTPLAAVLAALLLVVVIRRTGATKASRSVA